MHTHRACLAIACHIHALMQAGAQSHACDLWVVDVNGTDYPHRQERGIHAQRMDAEVVVALDREEPESFDIPEEDFMHSLCANDLSDVSKDQTCNLDQFEKLRICSMDIKCRE